MDKVKWEIYKTIIPTKGRLEDFIRYIDPSIEDNEQEFQIALILLAMKYIGTNREQLRVYTGLQEHIIDAVLYRMNGRVLDGINRVKMDGNMGVLDFWLGIAWRLGWVNKTNLRELN